MSSKDGLDKYPHYLIEWELSGMVVVTRSDDDIEATFIAQELSRTASGDVTLLRDGKVVAVYQRGRLINSTKENKDVSS